MSPSIVRALVRAVATAGIAALAFGTFPAVAQAPKAAAAKPAAFDASACFGCHTPVKALHGSGKHQALGCNTCHDGTAEH